MSVSGPLLAQYAADPDHPRWTVIAEFDDEHEAQGFAVWCQTMHSAMATTGPPLLTWEEVDHQEPPSEFLPPEAILIAVEAVDSANDRATGQGRVRITYRLVARQMEIPWDAPPSKGGD